MEGGGLCHLLVSAEAEEKAVAINRSDIIK